jgi:biopolymer transport protein ExbB/TolQ
MIIRVGPSLGLIGTLIPMGTGLAALGQGDMTKLSSDLVIAFTTTVVGLAIGIVAYFFYTIRRRWVELDIKNMELATEILNGDLAEVQEERCVTLKKEEESFKKVSGARL